MINQKLMEELKNKPDGKIARPKRAAA